MLFCHSAESENQAHCVTSGFLAIENDIFVLRSALVFFYNEMHVGAIATEICNRGTKTLLIFHSNSHHQSMHQNPSKTTRSLQL